MQDLDRVISTSLPTTDLLVSHTRPFKQSYSNHDELSRLIVGDRPILSAETSTVLRQINAYYDRRGRGDDHSTALVRSLHLPL